MIDDPWRDELVKIAERLEVKTKLRRWSDRTEYLIERDFALSAYAMQRLIESDDKKVPVRRFDLLGDPPASGAPTDVADAYDFDNGRRSQLSVADLCHEILHSFTFTLCCGETADLFDGVYFSSDRSHLYLVLASDYITLCEEIGGM